MRIVGLEEHFVTTDVLKAWLKLEPKWQDLSLKPSTEGEGARRLLELGAERLAYMDQIGMDVQVLSVTAPGLHDLAPEDAARLQTPANDLLAATVKAHPDRFAGWATLATPAPEAAARELERAVKTLGLSGGMLFGRARDRNLDHADFWPIFEAASAMRAPLYLHPQSPKPSVREAYYDGLGQAVDSLFARAGLGWHYESGIQLLRLILAGVFDRFPDLQIITGHWGEVVLFYLDRIDMLTAPAKLQRPISEYVRSHVMVTSSGIFSQRYLRWAIEVLGIDRILFATDYPFKMVGDDAARRFFAEAELSDAEREKIAHGNWERVCAGIRR